jgi:Integrase core domain
MDFIGELPKGEGKDVILVIIDKLTKYCQLLALSHLFRAAKVADVVLETIYRLHGLPQRIITDKDSIFTSNFWKELMGRLGISLNFSTSFHPQTNCQSEKLNQSAEHI